MEKRIRQELFDLGIHSNMRGYMYIIEAVKAYEFNVRLEDIYKDIAQKHNTTKSAIERTIRYAIDSADKNKPVWKKYSSYRNKAFISTLYYSISEDD